ncbi:50S ribosomal protein L30 [Candidatus Woesearchaeota archaeon]|nr:50S ribosomal protein L30 [Candidatus Woesearchaeota archaeon]
MTEQKQTKQKEKERLAAVRVRGDIKARRDIKETMRLLNLFAQNHCVVVDNNSSNNGMLNKVKDYITWGELEPELYIELIKKRGERYKGLLEDKKGKVKYNRFIIYNKIKYKKYFRLNPPKGGYERKGVKKSYAQGGALGYRGKEINKLIERML